MSETKAGTAVPCPNISLGKSGATVHESGYAKSVTAAATFSSEVGFRTVGTNMTTAGVITTGRLGTLGALLRPENYLLVLFAISTTLWTVAFLFYFLSAQVTSGFAAMARAVLIRRVRA